MSKVTAEVVVVGGGPVGLTAAVALAGAGIETVLVAMPVAAADNRTTALLASSVTALDTLDVWERCEDHAAPLKRMRLVDDTARLLRAPEVCFDAAEIGLPAFGYNIENRHLLAALEARARHIPSLRLIAAKAETVTVGDSHIVVSLSDGHGVVAARLAIGADGRRSVCRKAAGIETESRRYPQTALTYNLAHARPHNDTSTEFHTASGPFTLVPLPGQRSSLVFVVDPAEGPRIGTLAGAELAEEIERRSHSLLGKVAVEAGPGVFPLGSEIARRFGQSRIVLVGEAAHVMPPIGAQGLNLGLRDAATIGELAAAARRDGADLGADELTSRYEHMRRADVTSRSLAVDLLNRSLLSGFLPLQGARGFGLYLLDQIGPLRRAVMREGVAPAASQPRLMRGEAL
ncbi:MAG: UbiH/UbiF family hydroxylase [Xanthobacteraceae bacterium]|nr:UbiH/UbiF family hydroxylase [Xanthobacteraceae bacterium]